MNAQVPWGLPSNTHDPAAPRREGSSEPQAPQARDWRGGLCGEQAVELLRDFYAAGNPKGGRPEQRSCRCIEMLFVLYAQQRAECKDVAAGAAPKPHRPVLARPLPGASWNGVNIIH